MNNEAYNTLHGTFLPIARDAVRNARITHALDATEYLHDPAADEARSDLFDTILDSPCSEPFEATDLSDLATDLVAEANRALVEEERALYMTDLYGSEVDAR